MQIPAIGLPRDEIARLLSGLRQRDVDWRSGRVLTGLYDPGPEADAVIKDAYLAFLTPNALYPNLYPSVLMLENQVIRMLANLLGGESVPEPLIVGNCTSGGTESILMAVKAARDHARATRPEITAPEIALPITAHPAFHKAAHFLGLKPVLTPFVAGTFQADVEAMRAAITPNTILLIASAPCYSHGVIDPVARIAALASEHGLLCHVDACVGGVYLSVLRGLGASVPPFDLSVPGVTSLSVDMHKFGYAAKNVSAILYRSAGLRQFALYANARTTGYAVLNTTAQSSKTGGPVAGAWAALNHLGMDGYARIVRETQASTRRLIDGVNAIDGLRVLGEPAMCMFALASDAVNVFELDDEMTRRGWSLQPQFSAGGGPANLHVSVQRNNVGHEDAFLADLAAAMETLRGGSRIGDAQAIQAEVMRIISSAGPDAFARIAALAGMEGGKMPDGFARINTVLDALPDAVVEQILVGYLNTLYV